MFSFTKFTTARRTTGTHKAALRVEELETRLTPYATSGNAWLQPQLISLSFVPDGTNLGGVSSNLFATLDALWSTATWQKEFLRAAQVFAQQTNLNFTIVSDDGSDAGSGSYQQGAGNFGDIRMGAYSSGGSWLGMASYPQPACNYSLAGDWNLNASQTWKINQTGGYDLFTVAAHEFGHGLGLSHSTVSSAVMYSVYNAIKSSLRTDDINGIRAIYSSGSARAADSYDASSSNGSFATATDISSFIDGDLNALVTNLDITTVSDLDYYKVTVPANTTGTMVVKMQSSGLSMLSPLVKVYNSSQTEIGSASGVNEYGATLTVTINNVSAGQQYYILADGADNTAFGTGRYAVTLKFGSAASPTVPLPNTQTANGSPLQCGGGVASTKDHEHDHDHTHGDGSARETNPNTVDTGAATIVQILVGGRPKQTVETRPERPNQDRPAIETVDSVFGTMTQRELTHETVPQTTADGSEWDVVLAELFV